MPLIAALLGFAAVAAQPLDPLEEEQKRLAREILEQLVAEDENVGHVRGYRGDDAVLVGTRPHASEEGGVCRRDVLTIRRAAAGAPRPPGSSRILSAEAEPWFYVIADERERPQWELDDEALEARCATVSPDEARWFPAEDALSARSAVAGLFVLREELRRARPARVEWACRRSGCPDGARLAELIDPLDPDAVSRSEVRTCPRGNWCVEVQLDNPGCGGWLTQLRMHPVHTDRFRSAWIGPFVGALHCGESEMEPISEE